MTRRQIMLVVEDDVVLRDAYTTFFASRGYDVHGAKDEKEGLELALKYKPDLVLLDLLLPKPTGFDFLRRYDVKKDHPETKVFVVSNLRSPETTTAAEEMGAFKVLHKSFYTPAELAEAINEALPKS